MKAQSPEFPALVIIVIISLFVSAIAGLVIPVVIKLTAQAIVRFNKWYLANPELDRAYAQYKGFQN